MDHSFILLNCHPGEDETAQKESVFTMAAFDDDNNGSLDEEEFRSWFNTHPDEAYRVVQLNFTPEIEVFYMLFDRSLLLLV